MDKAKRLEVWNAWHSAGGPIFPHEKVTQYVFRNFGKTNGCEGLVALDLGCGGGVHTLFLASLGFDVIAVDVSPVALDITREKLVEKGLLDRVELRQSLLSELSIPPNTLDLVVSTGVLDYCGLEEAQVSAGRISDWLRFGGRAILIFAAEGDFRAETAKDLGIHCFTRSDAQGLLPASSELEVFLDVYSTTYEAEKYSQVDWLVTARRTR